MLLRQESKWNSKCVLDIFTGVNVSSSTTDKCDGFESMNFHLLDLSTNIHEKADGGQLSNFSWFVC